MDKLGKDLIFISKINRDGLGVEKVVEEDLMFLQEDTFRVFSLSLSNKTFIASGFNSYVVKLKTE